MNHPGSRPESKVAAIVDKDVEGREYYTFEEEKVDELELILDKCGFG